MERLRQERNYDPVIIEKKIAEIRKIRNREKKLRKIKSRKRRKHKK